MGFLYVAILLVLVYGLLKVSSRRYKPDGDHVPESQCDFGDCQLCRDRDGE